MRFSERTTWEMEESGFVQATMAARAQWAAAGGAFLDLTVANPTACGFVYDEALLHDLSDARAAAYAPEPLGMPAARAAVAAYYADAAADVAVDNICLTTSTSEAYSFLFRTLCDEGDEVLVASPSYPLFSLIARLDGVRLVEYPLHYDGGWGIDLHVLEAAMTERTRAVVVVHPNNPTGHFCSARERRALRGLCARRGLALIVDEVFLDYAVGDAVGDAVGVSFAAETGEALTFVLSGISKVCGLPQMKCSWIAGCGPAALVRQAMGRLEILADTFLSMNAPVQFALSRWLLQRQTIQRQIRNRMRENLRVLDGAMAGGACDRLAMDAGWTVVLRVPQTDFAQRALEAGVLVQPGSFYGMGAGRVVLSLLTPPQIWAAGVGRLAKL